MPTRGNGRFLGLAAVAFLAAIGLLTLATTARAQVALHADGWVDPDTMCGGGVGWPCDSGGDCSYSPGAGSDRLLVFVYTHDDSSTIPPTDPAVSVAFGGQPMTQAVTHMRQVGTNYLRTTIFYLREVDFPGGAGPWNFIVTGADDWAGNLASYGLYTGVDQNVPVVDTEFGDSDNLGDTVTTQAPFSVVQDGMAVGSALVSSAGAGGSWVGNTPTWTEGRDVGRCSVGHSIGNTTSAYVATGMDAPTATSGWDEYQVLAVVSLAPSATANHRSIGTNTGNLHPPGTASVPLGSTTVTFSAALPAPTAVGAVGVGDNLTIEGEILFIVSRDSDFQVTLQSPATVDHTTPTATFTITRAYNTLQAWEDPCAATPCLALSGGGRGGDLVAENRLEVGVTYKDGPFVPPYTSPDSALEIDGSTTGADNFMWLTVAPGQRHNGTAGTGVVVDGQGVTKFGIRDEDDFSRVEWLELVRFKKASDNGFATVLSFAANSLYNNLLIHDFLEPTATGDGIRTSNTAGTWNFTARNCIIYDGDRSGIRVDEASTTITVENSTIYNMDTYGVSVGTGNGGTATVTNTISMGNPTDFDSGAGSLVQSYNMSEDATASCGTCLPSEAPGAQFVSLAGTINLHLRPGADAIDAGTDLSASGFDNDVDDQTRPFGAGWEIGADESFFSGVTANYRSIGTAANLVNQGTITVTAGSAAVTKTGGLGWLAENRGRGDVLVAGPDTYVILNVISDDVLNLASLPSASHAGGYTIARQFRGAGVAEQALIDWEDCVDGPPGTPCTYFPVASNDLVADNRGEVGIAYKDTTFSLASGVTIQGAATDDGHTITLTADAGNRHYGLESNGVVLDNVANPFNAIRIRTDHVTLEWLEIKRGAGAFHGVELTNLTTAARITMRNLLIWGVPGDGIHILDADPFVLIYNNIISECNRGIRAETALVAPAELQIYNNTVQSSNGGGLDGYSSVAGANPQITLRNNIGYDNNTDFGMPNPNGASSHNMSKDFTAVAHSPAGFGLNGQNGAAFNFVDSTSPGVDLHIQTVSVAESAGANLSSIFGFDIDGGLRQTPWDIGADDIDATTAVELVSFEALPADSAVDLAWRTGSELDNLGFHLHRSLSETGPWTQITPSLIPGLGSSPEGASYSFRDTGRVNGTTYFYRLEDIDTSSVSTFHGPASATPSASAPPRESDEDDPEGDSDEVDQDPGSETQAYGGPGEPSLRVLSRTARSVVLELTTPGFVATSTPAGVRVSVGGFDARSQRRAPALPLKRALLDAVVGRHARIVWAKEKDVLSFPGLTPAAVGAAEVFVRPDGTVRPRRRQKSLKRSRNGLVPRSAARIAGDAFIGEAKKLALEMSPIRYDTTSQTLLLAQTLRVKIAFDRRARTEETGRGSRGRRRPRSVRKGPGETGVLAHLHTLSAGLHAVSFEALSLSEPIPLDSLRLSLLGEPVPFHVEPSGDFGPGSQLFFHAASVASSMDFSSETTYALERATGGVRMKRLSGSLKKLPKLSLAPLHETRFETNRFYQPGLLDAPDIWLWDFIVGGMSKSFPFALDGLDATSSQQAQIQVVFQGASDAETLDEHHLSVSLNGTPLGETSFDGKLAHVFSTSFSPSLLLEGQNSLTLTNLGDTGVYSFVFLDRFSLVYPRTRAMQAGLFEGVFSQKGKAVVSGKARYALDVTDPGAPRWLKLRKRKGTVRFKAQAGHRYSLASRAGLLAPRVSKPLLTGLRNSWNQADYVVIAPAAYLEAAQPLLERRQDQGLTTRAVSFEEITSQFGYGRPSAQAIRDFLTYAFHNWQTPSVKYVLLLGDASSDPRNFTGRDKGAPLPALWAKTSYLWTSSDPTLGAVNGEDGLPDLAIGRLPATTVEEAQALIQKVLTWEDTAQSLSGKAILVADNPDIAGDFEADIADIQASFLGNRDTQSILLRQYGANTRSEVLSALDGGASLLSYVGHGGPAVWASENVLNSWDPPKLLAQSEQPLMLTFNCLNGYFVAPNYDSLAEAFMKAEGRGTIGAFSPSGLSVDGPAHRFHRALMAEIVGGEHERLGDAVLAAQAAYADTGLMPELLAIYHLFADPGLRLRP